MHPPDWTIGRLMRRHRVTIRGLSLRMGIPQYRVRAAREFGPIDCNSARDFIEAITGSDPGPIHYIPPHRSTDPCPSYRPTSTRPPSMRSSSG